MWEADLISLVSVTTGKCYALTLNLLSPNSDKSEIALYIITTCSNIQVIRKKEVITKDKLFWYLDKFSLLVP